MRSKLLLAVSGVLFCSTVAGEDTATLGVKQQFSYGVGFQIAQDLKQRGMDVDAEFLIQAIRDVFAGAPLKVSTEEMRAAFDTYRQKQMAEHQAVAEKNKKAGMEFLARNKKEKGITELPSGLQYKVSREGTGKSPLSSDTVTVNYRGTLINGEEFDSSYQRGVPATFPVNGVIKGWQEALPMMKEGAKWQIYVPSELAYGPQGAGGGNIGPNETLIFDIELISIKDSSPN